MKILGMHIPGTSKPKAPPPGRGRRKGGFHGELDELAGASGGNVNKRLPGTSGGGQKAHHGHAYGTRKPRGPHMHGDDSEAMPDTAADAGDVGDNSSFEPNYGAGDTGSSLETSLDATGGMDPFANVMQPGDPGVDMGPVLDPGDIALLNQVSDPYDVTTRVATLRNPKLDFGVDGRFYETVTGPAAIIGGEGYGFAGERHHRHGLKK